MPFERIQFFADKLLHVVLALACATGIAHAQDQWLGPRHRMLVTTGGDPDPANPNTCSFRQALLSAVPYVPPRGNCRWELVPGHSDHNFSPIYRIEMAPGLENHYITLVHGQLEVMPDHSEFYDVSVNGRGLVVNANGQSRVMRVGNVIDEVQAYVGELGLEDMTLTGGNATGPNLEDGKGGGIYLRGNTRLALRRVKIVGNRATLAGGGMSASGGFFYHGADVGSTLFRIYDSTISDNEATGSISQGQLGNGGGLSLHEGCFFLHRTTISGNRAGRGGGIDSSSQPDPLHKCYDYQLSSGEPDTGLYIFNSTLSGNASLFGDGSIDYGAAAIEVQSGPLQLESTTVTGNHGLMLPAIVFNGPGSLSIVNSIVTGNVMDVLNYEYLDSADIGAVDGTQRTAANSVLSTTAQSQIGGTGIVWSDAPLLGPLADHGGWTFSHLPSASSPAVGLGREPECSTHARYDLIRADQRQVSRPQGLSCDAGAVERRQGSFVVTVNVVGAGRVDAPLMPSGVGSSGGIVNCTSSGGSCTATFVDENDDATMKFTAASAPGWYLASWSGDCSASPTDVGQGRLSIDGNRTCTATFSSSALFNDGFESAEE